MLNVRLDGAVRAVLVITGFAIIAAAGEAVVAGKAPRAKKPDTSTKAARDKKAAQIIGRPRSF